MLEIADEWRVMILAVIQGIAEFLPISSSGHVVIVDAMLGGSPDSARLNVALHFGTLLSIVVFYWQRIWALLFSDRRVIGLMIIGTIPAAVIGLTIKAKYGWVLEQPLLAAFMLPITGFMLLGLSRLKPGQIEYQQLSYTKAFLIGCAQAFALLPGISRSGSTIVAASCLGLTRQSAATFSFLLAIPAIGGASVLELKDIFNDEVLETPLWLIGAGALVSFVIGLGALSVLVRLLDQGRLHWFAYWLIPFGLAMVVWLLNQWAQQNLTQLLPAV